MVNSRYSVFLFVGNERYSKEHAIEELGSSVLGNSSKELDRKVFYGGESKAREILDYSTTLPFSAGKRFVVIKDFEKLPPEDKTSLITYIKKPSRHTCIAIDIKDDSLLKEFPSPNAFLKVIRFQALTDSELASWLKKYAASCGKEIEDEAIESLKELHGNSLLSLALEMDKLIAFIGERKRITPGDIEGLVGKALISSTFDLALAIGDKDAGKALELAYDLSFRGKRTYEIIGLLCWHFKRLLKAKLMEAKGKTNFYITNDLGLRRRDANQFFRQLKSFDIAAIRAKMEILLEADLDIKSSRLDPILVLEFALIRLSLG